MFAIVQVIVSISVCSANVKADEGGHKSVSFAALWSMFMAIIFTGLAAYVVLGTGRSSPLMVGFLLGVSTMMSELFFVLMAFFFTLGQIATTNHYSKFHVIHRIFLFLILYCS